MHSTRICNRCKKELPFSDFYSPPSGTRYSCKKCDIAYSRQYNLTHPEFRKRYEREYALKNPRRRWAHACLGGHRRRGITVEMTSKELFQLASRTDSCFICGCQLDWQLRNKGKMKKDSPTLDRLDNERVIRKENVAILCYRCNATKRDRTLKRFVEYCDAVVARFHSHFEYPQLLQR